MKKSVKTMLILFLCVSIALFTVSCGGKNDENAKSSNDVKTGTDDGGKQETKDETGDKINDKEDGDKTERQKIRVMSWWNFMDSKPLQELKSGFEAQNPGYELEFEQIAKGYADKLLVVLSAGGDQIPDVAMLAMDVVPRFAQAEAILPLEDYMTEDYKNSLYPVVLDALTYDGKVYAAPRDITTFVMFCNNKMFKDAGVEMPSEDWTWEDFLRICKELTKTENDQSSQWGYYFPKHNDTVFTWLIQNNGSYFTPDRNESIISSPESQEALQFLHDLIYKHKVVPTETEAKQFGDDAFAPLIAGKVGMMIGGLSTAVSLEKANFDYTMVPLPQNKKKATTAFVNSWVIPKGVKDPEASWKVLEFLASEKGQQIVLSTKMGLPASKDVSVEDFISEREDNCHLIDSLSYAVPFPSIKDGALYYDLVKTNLEYIWTDQKSVEEVTKEIDAQSKDILNK